MGLTAITLLGANTVSILHELCGRLGAATGLDLAVGAESGPGSPGDPAERAGDADLVWACGYLMCELIDSGRLDAEIVAAPVFAGEAGPVYRSVLITANPGIRSLEDACGGCVAINQAISWSGHHALVDHLAARGAGLSMFRKTVETGSHLASLEAVLDGRADVAAIDNTVWEHHRSTDQRFARLRVFDRTRDWPAPPFAVHHRLAAPVRRRLGAALASVPAGAIRGLDATVPSSRSAYDPLSPPRNSEQTSR